MGESKLNVTSASYPPSAARTCPAASTCLPVRGSDHSDTAAEPVTPGYDALDPAALGAPAVGLVAADPYLWRIGDGCDLIARLARPTAVQQQPGREELHFVPRERWIDARVRCAATVWTESTLERTKRIESGEEGGNVRKRCVCPLAGVRRGPAALFT